MEKQSEQPEDFQALVNYKQVAEKRELRAKLYKKISLAAKALQELKPESKAGAYAGGYSYIGIHQLMAHFGPVLRKHDMWVSFGIDSVQDVQVKDAKKPTFRSIVLGTMKVIDTETGFVDTHGIAGGENDNSKSVQQAFSQASKYGVFKLFNISNKDEVDTDGSDKQIERRLTKEQKWARKKELPHRGEKAKRMKIFKEEWNGIIHNINVKKGAIVGEYWLFGDDGVYLVDEGTQKWLEQSFDGYEKTIRTVKGAVTVLYSKEDRLA